MIISNDQLERWSHQGSKQRSSITYNSITTALNSRTSLVADKSLEIFLQGSYRNNTNIRGDSDIDVVVLRNSSFRYNIDNLSAVEIERFHERFSDARPYPWQEYRNDVYKSLVNYYGAYNVHSHDKSIRVDGNGSRVAADVVPSIEYRYYCSFPEREPPKYLTGISFFSNSSTQWIVNYPKFHYIFGVEKNDSDNTQGLFKRYVRIMKNLRSYLIDKYYIGSTLAPSYFIECILYNIDNKHYDTNYVDGFFSILDQMVSLELDNLKCQNKIDNIFGDGPIYWSKTNYHEYLMSIIRCLSEK